MIIKQRDFHSRRDTRENTRIERGCVEQLSSKGCLSSLTLYTI